MGFFYKKNPKRVRVESKFYKKKTQDPARLKTQYPKLQKKPLASVPQSDTPSPSAQSLTSVPHFNSLRHSLISAQSRLPCLLTLMASPATISSTIVSDWVLASYQ